MSDRTRERIGYRDDELGTALRELDVPEHAPGFDEALGRLLAAAAVDARAARPRRGRRPARRALVAAGAAAVAGFVLVATFAGSRLLGPAPASAAEVQARVEASLAAMRNASGVLIASGPAQGEPKRWRFTFTSAGDVRLEGPGEREVVAFDASTGVVRSAQRSASLGGGPLFYAERRGVGPGSPDGGPPTWIVPVELSAYVRALLAASDPRVREVAFDGRDAWRLDVEIAPNPVAPELSGDRLELVVDRETGFPVRVVERKDGRLLRELRIEQLTVNGPLAPYAFTLAFPPDAEVMRSDDGFRRVRLGDAASAAGYAPLVPGWVPDGYELAELAVGRKPGPGAIVSISYRRGLDRLLVTTRPGDGSAAMRTDPLAPGGELRDRPERIVLAGGSLRGADAAIVVVPGSVPHLWAASDGLVVTVSGDVARSELVQVAESLSRLH